MGKFNYSCSVLVLGVLIGSIQATAQQKDTARLEEVTVTAQKIVENPQHIPIGISVLTARKVADLRLQDTKQLSGVIPNLYSANPGDERNITSIRGISTTSYDPAVATYIDGVNQFGLDTYIAQLFDVERIEVLRGPQGTLYGRNAMGGVINIITKQPTNSQSGFFNIDFGNYGQRRYASGLREPLVKNKLFLGVAGQYTSRDGFYTNIFNHTKFDDQHSLTGNYYLKYLPGPAWGFIVNVKHTENRNNGAFPLAANAAVALSQPFIIDQNAVARMVDNLFNASLSANYTGRSINFNSQTAYQSNRRIYQQPIDGDFSPADAVAIVNDYGSSWNKVKVLTQEFRLSSPATDQPFQWTTGFYGFYQDNPVKQGTHFGKDAGLVGSPITNFTNINTNKGSQAGLALYAQASYTIAENIDFTAGIRYDYEHDRQQIEGEFQPDGGNAMVTQADTASATTFHAISPKISLAWHPTQRNLLYGTFSRGFRTGGISQLGPDPSQPPLYAYLPEYSNNFEIGSKNTLFNNRLMINLSAFCTLVNNAQVPALILPDAITITRNAGKLNSKGFEVELAATPFNGLEISNSFGYTDAKYTNLVLQNNGQPISAVANRPVFSPNVTSFTMIQYQHLLSQRNQTSFFIHAEWHYTGNQYFDLANQIEQRAYHLFNANAGFSIKQLSLSFWIKNLSNKHYIDYAYDFGAAHLGGPKTYGVSLSYKF